MRSALVHSGHVLFACSHTNLYTSNHCMTITNICSHSYNLVYSVYNNNWSRVFRIAQPSPRNGHMYRLMHNYTGLCMSTQTCYNTCMYTMYLDLPSRMGHSECPFLLHHERETATVDHKPFTNKLKRPPASALSNHRSRYA